MLDGTATGVPLPGQQPQTPQLRPSLSQSRRQSESVEHSPPGLARTATHWPRWQTARKALAGSVFSHSMSFRQRAAAQSMMAQRRRWASSVDFETALGDIGQHEPQQPGNVEMRQSESARQSA